MTLADDKRSYVVTEVLAGAGSHVVIPSHHENLPVATIGDAVFRGKTDLVSVEIPAAMDMMSLSRMPSTAAKAGRISGKFWGLTESTMHSAARAASVGEGAARAPKAT